MELTREQVQHMSKAINLEIPEAEISNVAIRLSFLLTAMEMIEREIGDQMDTIDPVPPIFPHEDF